MHQVDDEMPFASRVVTGGRVYQYVRRIPGDIADHFPFARIQRSLKTTDKGRAYEAAAKVHAEIERQFVAARRRKGTTLQLISVEDWEWPARLVGYGIDHDTVADSDQREGRTEFDEGEPSAMDYRYVPPDVFWRGRPCRREPLFLIRDTVGRNSTLCR